MEGSAELYQKIISIAVLYDKRTEEQKHHIALSIGSISRQKVLRKCF